MKRPRGSNSRVADPSPREITERSAEVRASWPRDVELSRCVQTVTPIILAPIDGESLGLMPDWRDVPI